METITHEHPLFNRLMYFIHLNIKSNDGCNGTLDNFKIACDDFKEFSGIEVDYEGTKKYFESRCGFCDCEIMMNIPLREEPAEIILN